MSRLFIALATVFLCGCIQLPAFTWRAPGQPEPRLLEYSYKAGDHLHAQLAGGEAAAHPMLAASFVDAANVENVSDLGRLLSEQVASRLSQHGYSVTEIQLRSDEVRVDPAGGVLVLSRDVSAINADVPAYSVLVGTYTVVGRQIYVNTRVLRASDGVALASSDFSMPHSRQARTEAGGLAIRPSVKTSLN